MAGGIKLAPLLTEIKVDIENFKSEQVKQSGSVRRWKRRRKSEKNFLKQVIC